MSEWAERILNHKVWQRLEELESALTVTVGESSSDPEILAALQRIETVSNFCRSRLKDIPPMLVNPAQLGPIESSLETVTDKLRAYSDSKETALLRDANTVSDSILTYLASLVTVTTTGELEELVRTASNAHAEALRAMQAATEARKVAEGSLSELRERFEAARSEFEVAISNLRSKLDAETGRLAGLVAEQQVKFSEERGARDRLFNDKLQEIQNNLNTVVTEHQSQFLRSEETRLSEFARSQEGFRNNLQSLLTEYSDKLTKQNEEFAEQRRRMESDGQEKLSQLHEVFQRKAQGILDETQARYEEVRKLVGVIGQLGVTGGYDAAARRAAWEHWFWQAVAAVSFGGIVYFAWQVFEATRGGEVRWEVFAARVVLTFSSGLLAAFAASQASKLFNVYRYHQKLALELAAIDPYIALLPEEERIKFKIEMGRRTFAQQESPSIDVDKMLTQSKSNSSILDLIAKIIERVPKP